MLLFFSHSDECHQSHRPMHVTLAPFSSVIIFFAQFSRFFFANVNWLREWWKKRIEFVQPNFSTLNIYKWNFKTFINRASGCFLSYLFPLLSSFLSHTHTHLPSIYVWILLDLRDSVFIQSNAKVETSVEEIESSEYFKWK